MILERTGKICDGLYSIGYHFIPAFLLMSEPPVLFDAGLTVAGPRYLENLGEYLDDADRLGYILLTHSHYDHCGAVPFLKRNIAHLKIAASRSAAETFKKETALSLIRSLSADYEKKFRKQVGATDIAFDSFNVDIILEDGGEFDPGDGRVIQVIATPGHTRDSVSYYIPGLKALIPGEAAGVLNGSYDIQPEFTSSYNDYISSLEKLGTLDIDIILLPHVHILTEQDARDYIPRSLEKATRFKKRIDNLLDRCNGDRDAVVQEIFREDYEATQAVLQDKRSFLINLQAKVRAVAEGK